MPKTITITLSNADLRVLEHDVEDPEQWIKDMIAGKINACTFEMAQQATSIFIADPAVDTIPAKQDKLIAEFVKRPDYKNRKQREDEEKARREADSKARDKAGKP